MKDTVKEVDFFDRTSKRYLGMYEKENTEGYSFRIRRDKVEKMIAGNNDGKTLLDIGSGPGIMIDAVLRQGYTVTAADAAPQMIELTKQQFSGNPKVEFLVTDAREIPKPDDSFDVATAMGLVEYFEEDDSYYKEMGRVLKKDGTLIVTYPNVYSPWRVFNRLALAIIRPLRMILGRESKKDNNIRHKEYTVKGVISQLKKHGFEAEEVVYYNFKLIPYPLDNLLGKFTVTQSKACEPLDRTFLKWLGTAFIVKAKNTN